MKKAFKVIGKLVIWVLVIFAWFIYAYSTLDRSSGAPLPSGYSFIVLPILITVLLRKKYLTKSYQDLIYYQKSL